MAGFRHSRRTLSRRQQQLLIAGPVIGDRSSNRFVGRRQFRDAPSLPEGSLHLSKRCCPPSSGRTTRTNLATLPPAQRGDIRTDGGSNLPKAEASLLAHRSTTPDLAEPSANEDRHKLFRFHGTIVKANASASTVLTVWFFLVSGGRKSTVRWNNRCKAVTLSDMGERTASEPSGIYTHRLPGSGVAVGWGFGTDEAAELAVRFDDDGSVIAVRLTSARPLTPSGLQRFAWKRWLTVADAFHRWASADLDDPWSPESIEVDDAMDFAAKGRRLRRQKVVRRPGRRGHPESHYREVAQRYKELRAAGVANPTETIARERNVNRNTVAGWLRTTRQRGFLLPARPGRPG